MTPARQPQHCDHECKRKNPVCLVDRGVWKTCKHDTRATHTSPPAPERYTGTCAMQEKCNDYADFCESIMEELTENEDEDPPCPIKCAKRVNPQQESIDAIRTEAAKAAREQVLKEIPDVLFCQSLPNEHGFCGSNDCFCKKLHRVESGDICKWMQSLRAQQQGGVSE